MAPLTPLGTSDIERPARTAAPTISTTTTHDVNIVFVTSSGPISKMCSGARTIVGVGGLMNTKPRTISATMPMATSQPRI